MEFIFVCAAHSFRRCRVAPKGHCGKCLANLAGCENQKARGWNPFDGWPKLHCLPPMTASTVTDLIVPFCLKVTIASPAVAVPVGDLLTYQLLRHAQSTMHLKCERQTRRRRCNACVSRAAAFDSWTNFHFKWK